MLILLVLLISVQHAYSVSTCNRRQGKLPRHGMFWGNYIGEWTYLKQAQDYYGNWVPIEGDEITSAMEDTCANRCKNPSSNSVPQYHAVVDQLYDGDSRDYFAFAVEIFNTPRTQTDYYYNAGYEFYPVCKCVHRDALNPVSSSPDNWYYNKYPHDFLYYFYESVYGYDEKVDDPIMQHIKDDNGDCPCYPGTYAPSCNIWTVCGSHEYETVSPTSQRNRVCELKVCICATGAGTTGNQCPTHGAQRCLTDLIPWEFYEFKDNTYLSTTQYDI